MGRTSKQGRCGTAEQRFWRKVAKGDGCWLWTGSLDGKGYGRFRLGPGKLVIASRFAYETENGPIGSTGKDYHGTCVLHSCDTPACVRPSHLRIGTQAENMMERDAKGRCRGPWTATQRH